MVRLWEYESRYGRTQRQSGRFVRRAQTSGFYSLVRSSLLSRGMDPDVVGNLGAPPVVVKPVDRDTIRQVVPEPQVRSAERALKPVPVSKRSTANRAPSDQFISKYLKEHFPGREREVDVKYVPGEGTFFTYKGVPILVPERSITIEELHGLDVAENVGVYGTDKALPDDSPLRPGGGVVSHPGVEALKGAGKVVELVLRREIESRGGLRKDYEPSEKTQQLEEEVSRQAALEITSILQATEPLDVPRVEVGKPVARVLLEPLALVADAANALSPANLPLVPSIRGLTKPPLTGGEIRGATSVEILSYITDPLNIVFFAGPITKAARVALLGGRLTLKESQLLRKAVPRARALLAEEAGGRIAFTGGIESDFARSLMSDFRAAKPATVRSRLLKDETALRPILENDTAGVADALNLDTVTERMMVQAQKELRRETLASLNARGLGDEFVVFRGGALDQEIVSVSLSPGTGRDFATRFGTAQAGTSQASLFRAYRVRKSDILADTNAFSKRLGLQEEELFARASDLTPLGAHGEKLPIGEVGGFPTRFAGQARKLEGGPPRLTKPVPVQESSEVKALRAKVTSEGRNPPPPPPPRLPGEPAPLLPGGQAPSMSEWRTIESGLFLSPRASNLMRRTGEIIGEAPAIKLFMKAITGPAALGRIIPEIRAGVVYRRIQAIMEASLGQRLVGSELAFHKAFTMGRDTSKIVIGGKEVAFGDFASDVLMGARIGSPRARFPVTAAQREWITTQKSLIDDVARQYEHVSGEELRLLGDDYWPRFTMADDGRVTIKGRVGAKQSPVKERKFLEMEESISRGTPYASPIETVQLYGRAMQKMTRDKLLIQVIKEDKIGRPVIKQLTQEIKALQARIKVAKPTTVDELSEVNVLRNKVGNLQAIRASKKRALIPAKQVLGPGFGKQLLEPEAAKVMQDIIGPGLGGKVGKGLRVSTYVASIPRFVVTGLMDVGQFFIQMLTLLATDPKSWNRAVGHSLLSLLLPEHWSRFLKTSPEAIKAARYGIGRGGIEFLEVTKRSAALGRIPGAKAVATVLGAAPRGFETAIEASRIFNFNSLARIQEAAVGKTAKGILPTTSRAVAGVSKAELEGELVRLSNYVKTKLGTTDLMGLGLSTTQRQVESAFLLYSPRYTRSVFGMLGWALSNGVPARDAQRALATMLFGGLAAFYGFARAVGLSHDEAVERINPASGGKFLALPMGGNEYGFGSAYRATLGFMGSLLRENSWDFDSWEEAAFDNPLANYLRSRTAPTTGTLIDFIEGEDFMGKEVDLNAFIDDPARLLDYATGKFLPLNLEALFEARGPLEQRILAGLTETVGGRSFPRSAFSIFEEAQEDVFQEKRSLGEKPYVDFDSFEDLTKENAPAVAVINTDPRVQNAQERLEHESRFRKKTREGEGFERLEETRVEQEKLQLEDDAAFNRDELAVSIWKDNFRGRQAEFFARRDEIVKDFGLKFGKDKAGVNAALDAYFSVEGENFKNPLTGGVDWDRFFAARDATLEGLSSANLKLVREYLRRYDTPTVRTFRKAQEDLEEYWAIEDLVWSRLRENDEFSPFLNLSDYLAHKIQSLLDSGVPGDEVSRILSRLAVVSNVTSMVAKLRNRYRLTHPDKDDLLGKWYGLSPAKPQQALSRPGRRGRAGRSGR